MLKSILLFSIIILASACISQTQTTSAGATTTSLLPAQARGEDYLGSVGVGGISLKQFSAQMESEAKKNFADACLISVVGNILSEKEKGKAGVWIFKYISKSESRAIGLKPELRLTAAGVNVYLVSNSLKLFKDEPFKECLDLSKIVDSTDAAKALTFQITENGGITLENNIESSRDEYEFVSSNVNAKGARVDANTGGLIG